VVNITGYMRGGEGGRGRGEGEEENNALCERHDGSKGVGGGKTCKVDGK